LSLSPGWWELLVSHGGDTRQRLQVPWLARYYHIQWTGSLTAMSELGRVGAGTCHGISRWRKEFTNSSFSCHFEDNVCCSMLKGTSVWWCCKWVCAEDKGHCGALLKTRNISLTLTTDCPSTGHYKSSQCSKAIGESWGTFHVKRHCHWINSPFGQVPSYNRCIS
jgi:hypothetical protein